MALHEVLDLITGEDKKKRKGQLALSFLVGSAIGCLGALLTAPQSGESSRRDIADAAISTRLRVERAGVKTSNRIKETKDVLSDNIHVLSSDIKQSVDAVQTTVSEIQDLAKRLSRTVRYFERSAADSEATKEQLKAANEKLKSESDVLKRSLDG